MKKHLKIWPFVATLALFYYLLPLVIVDTGSGMFVLLLVLPLITFSLAAACGAVFGFTALFAVSAAVLFVPSIFIFYNESALFYAVIYSVIALVGSFLGSLFHKKK